MQTPSRQLETDPRFPSGKWVGFWSQKDPPIGKQQTEAILTFAGGTLTGEGRDIVGDYEMKGQYNVVDGHCDWVKQYVGKHAVLYHGFNEGKGIWGSWCIAYPGKQELHGGFHIWPEVMGDPTDSHLSAEEELPFDDSTPVREAEPIAAPCGS